MAEYTKPEKYYEKLHDEIFEGKYEGLLDLGRKKWMKIEIVKMNKSMEKGLKEIQDEFKQDIWKGFKKCDDYYLLYVERDDDLEEGIKTEFKIENHGKFTSKQWRKEEEYNKKCGYYFILKKKKIAEDMTRNSLGTDNRTHAILCTSYILSHFSNSIVILFPFNYCQVLDSFSAYDCTCSVHKYAEAFPT